MALLAVLPSAGSCPSLLALQWELAATVMPLGSLDRRGSPTDATVSFVASDMLSITFALPRPIWIISALRLLLLLLLLACCGIALHA